MLREIDWNVSKGLLTQCYRNLNQKGVMSIRQQVNKSWLVVGHSQDLVMRNVNFQVSLASRDRVIRSGHKNVHAWAVGTLIGAEISNLPPLFEIYYSPFEQSWFTLRESGERLDRADYLVVVDRRVYCSLETQPAQLTLF